MNTDKVFIHGIEYVPKVVPEPAKVLRWKPDLGEIYWLFGSSDTAYTSIWNNAYADHYRYTMGNIYQTENLATRARDKQLLLVELQDYADEKNAGQIKEESVSHLFHNPMNKGWRSIRLYSNAGMLGEIVFYQDTDLYDAIEHFGSRLDLLL
ncbi:MAG: hypothetical protein [Cryophage ML09]|nr:MAG: hypothetical protein [Cryophage ML09]